MRQLISTLLAAHWAGIFGLLAVACAAEPHSGTSGALRALGLSTDEGAGGTASAAVLSAAFALAALLFAWMLAACLFSGGAKVDALGRNAFAGALAALLCLLCLGYPASDAGMLVAVECVVAALAASYLAVCAEQLLFPSPLRRQGRSAGLARSMALGAAHSTQLSRMSGRADAVTGEF